MRFAGIDVGSRTVKLAIVEDGQLVYVGKEENSFQPIAVCRRLLQGQAYERMVATGYGRHLFAREFECETISEIKAFAIGAHRLVPSARTVIDIGGQDVKAIALDGHGRLAKFDMNDKCAAGTGRFLEITAMALGYSLDEFSAAARAAHRSRPVNSMCTVFAESEVISAIAGGADRDEIALGIHEAAARRAGQMLRRVGLADDVVFAGGVACNECMKELLGREIGANIVTPREPQITGALGCAMVAEEKHRGSMVDRRSDDSTG